MYGFCLVFCLVCLKCVFVQVTVSFEDNWHACLLKLWQERINSDVILVVNHTHIQAHKIILMAQSQYFNKLLFGSLKERNEDVIEIKEVPNDGLFEALIKSAYTGSITLTGTIQVSISCQMKRVFQID